MAKALDARDAYTAGHSHRVSEYSVAIAQTMGLTPEAVEIIRIGAELHDIGKIGVCDCILLKPTPLNEAELAVMQQHPMIGADIVRNLHR